ncbi:PadR family transcriptional regulator [Caldibacillus debilis]|uniref:PadR family transcriptional regulator n=1 Tax=Caldibacillus debilis TaxID=301148 RepID=UPI0003719D60|nr:PadR family transcriptional regulator [Caldibacillus debilis]
MARLMVLGFLNKRPMSGYEIQQHLQQGRTEEWTNVLPGSLYHALKQLEKEGLVKVREVVRTGHRSKAVYEITEKGREAYTAMLREALQTPDLPYPRNFYSALAFLADLPKEEIRQALSEHIEEIKKKMENLKIGRKAKTEAGVNAEYIHAIFANAEKHIRLHLEFLHELQQLLEKAKLEDIEIPKMEEP